MANGLLLIHFTLQSDIWEEEFDESTWRKRGGVMVGLNCCLLRMLVLFDLCQSHIHLLAWPELLRSTLCPLNRVLPRS